MVVESAYHSPVLQYDDLLLAAAEPRIDMLAQFTEFLQADAGDARLQVEYPVVLRGGIEENQNGVNSCVVAESYGAKYYHAIRIG